MDHLACFTPGMLALGAKYGAVTGAKAEQYMQLGRNLTETCYQMYARQPTGGGTKATIATGWCTLACQHASSACAGFDSLQPVSVGRLRRACRARAGAGDV